MRTLTTYSLTLYKHHHFVMVLVFILLGLNCKATIVYGDTSRTSYPINDPRNPNCPCHLYQKMADDEYTQLLQESNNKSTNGLSDQSSNELQVNKENSVSAGTSKSIKHKRKVLLIKRKKFKRIYQNNRLQLFKRFKDPTACFSWR